MRVLRYKLDQFYLWRHSHLKIVSQDQPFHPAGNSLNHNTNQEIHIDSYHEAFCDGYLIIKNNDPSCNMRGCFNRILYFAK